MNGQHDFHISLLYGAHERQQTNIESDAIGTRVVFRPEKFTMRGDMSKRRMTESLIKGCKD